MLDLNPYLNLPLYSLTPGQFQIMRAQLIEELESICADVVLEPPSRIDELEDTFREAVRTRNDEDTKNALRRNVHLEETDLSVLNEVIRQAEDFANEERRRVHRYELERKQLQTQWILDHFALYQSHWIVKDWGYRREEWSIRTEESFKLYCQQYYDEQSIEPMPDEMALYLFGHIMIKEETTPIPENTVILTDSNYSIMTKEISHLKADGFHITFHSSAYSPSEECIVSTVILEK